MEESHGGYPGFDSSLDRVTRRGCADVLPVTGRRDRAGVRHASVFLFFAGLVDFLFSVNDIVAPTMFNVLKWPFFPLTVPVLLA